MPGRIRRSLTFANVCSFLALTIALGTGAAYAENTVFSTDIVNGEVKAVDIAAGAVATGKIAGNAVNASKVLDETLGTADLAPSSVGSDELATGSVLSDDIAPNAVGTTAIVTDGVGATEVQDNSIDAGEIVDGTVTTSEIASNAITASEIASNAITGSKVANGGLTMSDIKGADNSGSIGLSQGAVANGRCKDFALAIPGARIGDAVVLSLRGPAPAGMLFYGVRVEVDDEAIMKVCNLTGGVSPQISSLPIRLFTLD